MELTDIARRFVVHWGEMGSNWGVNRSVAQIHALLFVHGRPLHAEDIADTLALARSNVSNSLKELQNWRLIRVTHELGDRRDYYETSGDVWELFRTIVRERKEREFDPTVRLLRELSADPALAQESPALQDRLRSTMEFMQTLGSWSDEMLRLSPATLEKILRLGAQVQRFVRPAESNPPSAGPATADVAPAFPAVPPFPPMA
ncbi:GbsR/MarR family transcriptional regulator [Roseateles saccharophilus]|uniref:HTH-type transcriptional regulator n=2 Tax=Roseateles saccharophilus TaxID=304 RepID=A0A4R3V1J4_ROSSA|nr:MarR family transcriptional regulator [Roseateles saccharophilus]MDG0831490.1 MarR family transcriptional regulator [Roseateles saccharophilus]TCU98626.1 DNA-binding transcriptional regulator GbsR (MarR family) [Roseateles saccharophilus]